MRFHLHLRFLSPIRRAEVLAELQRAATPGFDFFLLVVLSCSVASFGLIIDSPAVIIGAMLIAPLMSPILGLSLASVAGERKLFQHAVLALAEGAALAVMLAASWGGVARQMPFDFLLEVPAEMLARAHPSPVDLLIAVAGGAAAAYCLAQPNLSAALPGVSIATALMPPLCTMGLGLALGNTEVVGGGVFALPHQLCRHLVCGDCGLCLAWLSPRALRRTLAWSAA